MYGTGMGQGDVMESLRNLTPEQKRLAVIAGVGAILVTASDMARIALTLFGAYTLYRQYGREMHQAAGRVVDVAEEYIEIDEDYIPEF